MTAESNQPDPKENNIATNEDRFKALVSASSDLIYSLNADWTIMHELDGRGILPDAKEATSHWFETNVYELDRATVREAIDKAILTKTPFEMEHRINRVDGSVGWTFSKAIPILSHEGEIVEWFGTASDITEKKSAEEALEANRIQAEQQKRVYETITATTPDLMYVFDLNYRFTYVNKALLTMWGKTWENAVGKGLLENGYEPWHAAMHEREIDEIVANGKPIRGEVSFPHATLGTRVYDYILTPVFNANGEIEAVAGTTRDVTDRKHWEEVVSETSFALQATNEELATINEEMAASNEELVATNDQLASLNEQLIDAQHRIEESEVALRLAIDAANFGTWFIHSETLDFVTDARLKELFGYYADESLSIEQALAQITDEYRGFVADKLQKAIYQGGDYDVTYPVVGLHDERLRWLRAIGNLKADPSGGFSAFTGVVMDITDQYLAAEKIEQAEESLRMAIESGELATWFLDESLGKIKASPRLNEIFGLDPHQVLTYEAFVGQISSDYRQMIAESINNSFATGALLRIEYPIITLDDGKQRWVRAVGKLVEDDKNGKYITGVMADITEQKTDEMRKNDFIGMVSHELKTPLTSMKGYIQVILRKRKQSEDEFVVNALQKANAQAEKMTTMINGFLNLSRLESGKIHISPERFDLAELVQESNEEVLATISSHKVIFAPMHRTMIDADRDKIGQVIHNLISNAAKYSPLGSTIHVACVNKGTNAELSVKDQGIGIREEDLPKIFDRFYRVQDSPLSSISGFGIGLYLCWEIITRHQGKIWAESEFGKGSTFTFSLAILDEK